jgi:Ser/Thr protein kinase RdoA (MazF antagonist)
MRFVLKGFAESWPRERAEAIHRWMAAARRAGVGAVPANLEVADAGGAGVTTIAIDGDGRCFELTQWCPGQPVAAPSPGQATAALEMLARIHVALREAGGDEETPTAPPPAWARRAEALRAVIARGWDAPVRGIISPLQAAVAERRRAAAAILRDQGGLSYLSRLAAVVPPPVPLQPVLRDIWQAHVLFVGDELSAVIDWHAAGIDTPATDLARLLGSWEGPRSAAAGADSLNAYSLSVVWGDAIDAYRAIRPLSREEMALIDLLHLAGVVGGLHHWFTWVLDEKRDFPDPSAVVARVDALLKNLAFSGEKTDGGSGGLH